MKKNLLVAQSGGPSSAINATLSGILMEAIRSPEIDKVYGGANGIYGIISQQIADLSGQVRTTEDFKLLETTPGMALGSCRFKLPPAENDTKVYEKLQYRLFSVHRRLQLHGYGLEALPLSEG